jgi:amino acid transporter
METELRKTLSLFDSTCIIVGIIIGAGIYETAPIVAGAMGGGVNTIVIWFAGGLLALSGAINYAELATAYPKQGGDYVYLSRAYGPGAGFLFAWTQLVIIRPGDIVLMAFVFGRYASRLYPLPIGIAGYAASAVIVLGAINIVGVRQAKWTQNILTVIKVLGLLAIAVTGFFAQPKTVPQESLIPADIDVPLALILVLFTFGGWNEMAYVAAEVKNTHKNIVRALLWGTATVSLLYVLVNISFLYALGYSGTANSQAVAVDTVATVFPGMASRLIGIIICISSLGAVNGLIFTGARISYALGSEHPLFRLLGKWNPRLGTPVWALAVQSTIGLAIILFAGSFINTIFYTAPLVWTFFLATGLSVWVLRRKEPGAERRFKVPFFPVPTVIFCAASAMMLYSTAAYAVHNRPKGFIFGIASVAAGAMIYKLARKRNPVNKGR